MSNKSVKLMYIKEKLAMNFKMHIYRSYEQDICKINMRNEHQPCKMEIYVPIQIGHLLFGFTHINLWVAVARHNFENWVRTCRK